MANDETKFYSMKKLDPNKRFRVIIQSREYGKTREKGTVVCKPTR